jgi:hypothetical protein
VSTTSSDGNASAWTDGYLVVSPGGTSTSGGLGLSYNTSTNEANISSLTPSINWRNINYRSNEHIYYTGGIIERVLITASQTQMSGNMKTVYGPNSTWGASLTVGGNGDSSGAGMASMVTTNGNLHLDAADGAFGVYLNHYGGNDGTYFGNGSGGIVARITGTGALSKSSGSFRISHPHPSKSETHDLVHSFVESPNADNVYSGMVTLENGRAEINLDVVSRMIEGTFVLLNS